MNRVAVTGAAGPVGRRLVARLSAADDVSEVVAIDRDRVPTPDGAGMRVVARRLQLRDGDLDAALDGVDTLCHLAGTDPLEERAVDHDLHTTTRILEAAVRTGVRQIVYRSSATVYGAWSDNPVPLSETAPIRPNAEGEWVQIRAQVEDRVQAFARAHPDVTVAIARPCVTVSSEGPDELGRVLAAARLIAPTDDAPAAQFVHVDDVAAAIDTIRTAGATGVFNVAPDGSLDAEWIRALVGGGPRVPLPESLTRRLTAFGWRYQLAPTPPGFVPYVLHPWVIANDRLRALGWDPEYANEEAFVVGHAAAPWAAISPQRRQEIALGVAGAALAGLAGVGAMVLRRRLRS